MIASRYLRVFAAVLLLGAACARRQSQSQGATVTQERFGTLPDGRTVDAFTLTNARGLEVRAITYGGIITSIRVPDRTGHLLIQN